jgi:general secretion pathway protein F
VRYALKAVDASSRVVVLDVEGPDEGAVRQQARHSGLSVLSVRRKAMRWERTKPFPTALFSVELLALLDAGLNVVEALQGLAEKEPHACHKQVIGGVLDGIRRGESLSQSIARFPSAFSSLYVATVRSTERTGNLKDALQRFVAYEEELEHVRKKLVAALIYPAILIVVGTLVLAFLLLYVVPRFASVYDNMRSDLPFFSSVLLTVGRGIEQHGAIAATLLAASISGVIYALSRESTRASLLRQLWRFPALGERLRVYQLARLYRTLGMLLRAGIPVVKALEMVPGLLSGELKQRLARAKRQIEQGTAMSAAFAFSGLATSVASRMMTVGERSGEMGELLDRAARFCDDETSRFVDAFTRVFEPALMALLGLAVGGIVVLMYMPVFELAGSVR